MPPGGSEASKTGARPKRELTDAQVELADSMVIHRDRSAIVLNKPPGLATQGGSGTYEHVDGLLDAYVQDGPRPRLVHRLDKDTSGVLLIAATPGSAAYFSKRFSGRSARKIYWALVVGVPSINDGLIELPLAKQPGTGGEKMMVDESAASPRGPATACSTAPATAPAGSSSSRSPAAPTSCACTWPRSATRSLAMASMAGKKPSSRARSAARCTSMRGAC